MKKLAILIFMTPLLIAGGGDFELPQQVEQHIVEPAPVNWTLILTGFFGTVTACVPAYFTYKTVKARRARGRSSNGSRDID